ncbi:hypothetical protein ACIGW1_05980 [Streptomyces sp. NPDC053780]|uniref:hypothetical protein n=1 Tax=unclassified Streptomyces TaxID=2593676 RepID=UPI003446F5EC
MSRRLSLVLTVLFGVLLPLVPAWPAVGVQVGPGGRPLAAAAVTGLPHPAPDLHADDGCTPACAAQPRARHDQPGEGPTAPDRQATATAHGTGTCPGARTRTVAAPGPVPVSPGRRSHDSGRAPPLPSGP